GLNWQLPLYLQALLQNAEDAGRKALPAGMFYVPVQEIIKSVKSGEDEGAAVKLQGLAILDMEALILAERDLDAGCYAKTMQVHIKKDNTFGSTTLGLTPSEYNFVQNCLLAEAGEKLDAIMQGELSQRPVAPGGRPICEYCDYYALCAVDLAVEPQICPLEKLSKDEVLHRLAMKYGERAALYAGRNDGEEGEYGLDG
ncbi:MAG: PD-(D/E)XK nuclease family protein, partial [Firmicutes bacterium]|nr:PD-(D/E)XK nuclease family protein [Bacillota bacterium]